VHDVREGRFVFQGGCFDCHARERFPLAHTHTADEMAACGTCHNAHGSTERAFLDAPRDKACSRCHALR
jgi:predicted CXXCH cytochrome family protein